MGSDFDALVRGEDTRVERELDSIETLAISLLVGAASLAIALAIRRPDCLGSRFLHCLTEWAPPEFPHMLVGAVVAGVVGLFLLWTTRRRDSGLSNRALGWGAAAVIALSIGAAVQLASIPLFDILIFYKALMVIVTAGAAVVSARAWWDIQRGRRVPTAPVAPAATFVPAAPVAPVATFAPTSAPFVTVTRRTPSAPMLWVARLLWVTPLGLLFSLVTGIVENNRRIAESQPMDDMSFIIYVMVFGAFLIVAGVVFALSFAAYRAVLSRSAVARGAVLVCAFIIFALCGEMGWGIIATNDGGFGLVSLGAITMLAIGLAGIGAIVWYFVDAPSG